MAKANKNIILNNTYIVNNLINRSLSANVWHCLWGLWCWTGWRWWNPRFKLCFLLMVSLPKRINCKIWWKKKPQQPVKIMETWKSSSVWKCQWWWLGGWCIGLGAIGFWVSCSSSFGSLLSFVVGFPVLMMVYLLSEM